MEFEKTYTSLAEHSPNLSIHCREMSAFRISVEWGIGRVKTLWKAVSNKVCKDLLRGEGPPEGEPLL
jgi:hypothetical protein